MTTMTKSRLARQMGRISSGLTAGALALTLAACGVTGSADTTSTGTTATAAAASSTSDWTALWDDNTDSHAESDDAEYDAATAVKVTLDDAGSTASGDGVTVDGSTVTITAPGTYVLTGTLSDGQLVVDSAAEGAVKIVLAGASITSSTTAAVNVKAADEAVLVLAEGTTNTVSDTSSYPETDDTDAPNAAIFSMADLTIGGSGTLTVQGNGNDGIASKDGLVILAGTGTINVTAVDDGVRGKDYVIIEGGTLDIAAGGDGVKSDNETHDTVGYIHVVGGTVSVAAGDDGFHAEGDLAIDGGDVTVSKSNEGIEGANIALAGGTVTVTATDDGVNASSGSSTDAGSQGGMQGGGMQNSGELLLVSGGTNVVTAEGDGLDSNGTLLITGGTTVVNGPSGSGNGALDSNGGIAVNGGTVVAAGSAGMVESPDSESAQGWVAVTLDTALEAGQTVQIVSGGTVVGSYTAAKSVQSVILSTAGLTNGQAYDVYVGGQLAADAVSGLFSLGGSTSGASQVSTVTAGEAAAGGMGGGMGRGPGGPRDH